MVGQHDRSDGRVGERGDAHDRVLGEALGGLVDRDGRQPVHVGGRGGGERAPLSLGDVTLRPGELRREEALEVGGGGAEGAARECSAAARRRPRCRSPQQRGGPPAPAAFCASPGPYPAGGFRTKRRYVDALRTPHLRRVFRAARLACRAPDPGPGEPMNVSVPKETASGERRVALVPEVVERLGKGGIEVTIEAGAGAGRPLPGRRLRGRRRHARRGLLGARWWPRSRPPPPRRSAACRAARS